MTQSV